tara:strand:+ start:31 stop:303 length:273 start_codon:yes stop_codon:yes gene_type:complete
MKKYLFIVLLLGFCLAQKKEFSTKSKEAIVQIGAIDEFVLNQGYPFKKEFVYGKIIIQQGRLDEFVLNQGYPFKKKSGSIGSNFKIIIDY